MVLSTARRLYYTLGLCIFGSAVPQAAPAAMVDADVAHRTPNQTTLPPVEVIGLRKFPYPYKAMLAISSDADHQTLRKFNLIHRYLNTYEMTPMGKGLGLDIADSFFMYNASDVQDDIDYDQTPLRKQLTYFRGTSQRLYAGRILDAYIRAGWMDTLHTYGDFSMQNPAHTRFHRSYALQAMDTLRRRGHQISVWVDHGNEANVQNFGSYRVRTFFRYQQGSNPWSPFYHTDILIPYGVKFVWTNQQNTSFGHDSMLFPMRLPDGQVVLGFPRFTNLGYVSDTGTEWVWSMDRLKDQLKHENLTALEEKHQYTILAQHFNANNDRLPIPQSALEAFRGLAMESERGNILVARTSRLLQYNLSQTHLRYYVSHKQQRATIHIAAIDDPVSGRHIPLLSEIRGITFYTTVPARTDVMIGNQRINRRLVQENPTDGQSPSISIRWFPRDTKDYSKQQDGMSIK